MKRDGSRSRDVNNLYQKFRGDAARYQELHVLPAPDDAQEWPLLAQMPPAAHAGGPLDGEVPGDEEPQAPHATRASSERDAHVNAVPFERTRAPSGIAQAGPERPAQRTFLRGVTRDADVSERLRPGHAVPHSRLESPPAESSGATHPPVWASALLSAPSRPARHQRHEERAKPHEAGIEGQQDEGASELQRAFGRIARSVGPAPTASAAGRVAQSAASPPASRGLLHRWRERP